MFGPSDWAFGSCITVDTISSRQIMHVRSLIVVNSSSVAFGYRWESLSGSGVAFKRVTKDRAVI